MWKITIRAMTVTILITIISRDNVRIKRGRYPLPVLSEELCPEVYREDSVHAVLIFSSVIFTLE